MAEEQTAAAQPPKPDPAAREAADDAKPTADIRTANANPVSAAVPTEISSSRTAPENSGAKVATPLPRARPRAPLVREARQAPEVDTGDVTLSAAPQRQEQQVPIRPQVLPEPAPNRDDHRAAEERYRQQQAELARQFRDAEIRQHREAPVRHDRQQQIRRYRAVQRQRPRVRYYRAGAYEVRRTRYGYELRRRPSFDDAFR
ncbi:MAG TPA: hypothetical protein VE224_15440 [Pseudolabrys sp.]|nr:hypothetical protein [Pseudolabrys sp.]